MSPWLHPTRCLLVMLGVACLAGCSSQDFGTTTGGINDVVETGQSYTPKGDEAAIQARAQQLANALLAWQRQQGIAKEDYSIGPDDVLAVTIFDLTTPGEPTVQRLTVTQNGMALLPLIGEVLVAGLTARQAEARIIGLYAGEYLKDPRVTVEVAEFKSAPVVVTGAVGSPGIYYLQHNRSTVLDMLSLAQGLSASAGQELLIVRNRANAAIPAAASSPDAGMDDEATLDYDFSKFPAESNSVVAATDAHTAPSTNTILTPSISPAETKKSRLHLFGKKSTGSAKPAPTVAATESTPAEKPAKKKSAKSSRKKNKNTADTNAVEAVTETLPLAAADSDTADTGDEDGPEMITVDLKRLLDRGDIRLNATILGGDIITVPARQLHYVYVLGYVQRAGAFEIEAGNETIPALQAVALAGGLSPSARAQNSFLIRQSDNRRQVIPVNLTKIARGDDPPVFMQPGDSLVIGSSWLAKLGEFIKPSASVGASVSPVP